ncbi:hypothetical protein ACFQV4_01605 [Streptomyces thermocarboxydus]
MDGATTKLLWLSLGLGVAVAVGVITLGNGAVRLGLRPSPASSRRPSGSPTAPSNSACPSPAPTRRWWLGLALNTMLDRLRTALRRTENSEQRLRHFMADAGHELRTRSPPCRGSPICCCTSRTCRRPGVRRRTP